MSLFFRNHLRALALVLAAGLLLAAPAPAASPDEAGRPSVRMAVDPTVLPQVEGPVAPPEKAAPAETPDNGPGQASEKASGTAPEKAAGTAPGRASERTAPGPAAPDTSGASAAPGGAGGRAAQPAARPAPVSPPAPVPAPARAARPASGPGTVDAVTLESGDHGFVLAVTTDRPVGDTSYLNLTGPRRLVLDLRGTWVLGTRNVFRAPGGAVLHVVAGEHPDRLRFVVYFRRPPARGVVPVFTREGNRLVVRVALP